jgi:hypothetical protein
MRPAVYDDEVRKLIGGPPRLAFEDVLHHPRLPEARKLYVDGFLAVYGDDPFLVRLLIESGRFFVFNTIAVLEAAQDADRRETWLTIGRLKDKMTTLGLASGRHVDQLIGRLCSVGFIEQRPAEQDRRMRILRGTDKLWAHYSEWLAAHFAPLAHLFPQHDYGPVLRRDLAFQAHYLRTAIIFYPFSLKMIFTNPDIMLFFARAGGYMVITALAQAAMAGGGDTHAAVPYADVGERFGISRTHVRRLLTDAETAGLVKLHARGGRSVELLPRLWDCYDRSTAIGMWLHDMAYLNAIGRRGADDGSVPRLA